MGFFRILTSEPIAEDLKEESTGEHLDLNHAVSFLLSHIPSAFCLLSRSAGSPQPRQEFSPFSLQSTFCLLSQSARLLQPHKSSPASTLLPNWLFLFCLFFSPFLSHTHTLSLSLSFSPSLSLTLSLSLRPCYSTFSSVCFFPSSLRFSFTVTKFSRSLAPAQ